MTNTRHVNYLFVDNRQFIGFINPMTFNYLTSSIYEKHPLINWVDRFMQKAKLYPRSGHGVIGVSGGKDSMLLLFVLYHLYKKKRFLSLKVVHIDHRVREDSHEDGELLKRVCDTLNLPLEIVKLERLSGANFEHQARKKRYLIFKEKTGKEDMFYTAHHIDDSFEWALMSQLKTGSIKNTLGIPLIHQNVARPFMCLTKNQINSFNNKLKIPFKEDITNSDSKFERNFLRNNITKLFKKRFPSHLKHYVFRSNELAYYLGCSLLKSKTQDQFILVNDEKLGDIFIVHPRFQNDFSEAQSIILSVIQKLSDKERGVLTTQVKKLLDANMNHKKGPLTFSGGVSAYLFFGMIYFLKNPKCRFAFHDEKLLKQLDNAHIPEVSLVDFQKKLMDKTKKDKKPAFLAFGLMADLKFIMPSQKKIDSHFQLCQTYAIENNYWFGNPYQLLSKWGRKEHRHRLLKVIAL